MSDPIQIGDFRIERQIGAGGMGIVYLATQVSLNRKVALKVLGQSLTRQSDKQRFQREAQAVAKLNHPNIAKVHYVGQDDRLCYMAMEYIDGVSLRDCVERLARTTKPDSSIDDFVALPIAEPAFERFDETEELAPTADFSPSDGEKATVNPYRSPQAEESITSDRYIRRCAEIVRDVANALQHAHDQGVIHRDLKPDNLMLDKDGKVHIIDFGVARFFEDATLTQTGALVGTPIYMSPEQVTGRIELDTRTDIYSLGIVLYELLVLRQPITATSRDGVLRSIVVKPLRPVSQLNSQVPESLQNVVHKATAKNPDSRYQNANGLADDLDRFIAGEQVHAHRYRYKTDDVDIKGQRPSIIVGLAVLNFAIVLQGVLMLPSFLWASLTSELNVVGYSVAALTLVAIPWLAINGWGLMAGLRWAKISYAIQLFVAAAILACLPSFGSPALPFYVCAGLLPCIALVPYVSKKSGTWFEFARQVRSEEATDV